MVKEHISLSGLERLPQPTRSVPLRGYVVNEDEVRFWIQDREGTWLINKADVTHSEEWKGTDPRFSGRPISVFVREGADIYELKRLKVRIGGRPLTLGDPQCCPTVKGQNLIEALAKAGLRHLGFMPGETILPLAATGHVCGTVCCYETSTQSVCEEDDCGFNPITQ